MNKSRLISFFLFFILLFGCKNTDNKSITVYYNGCSEDEVISDLEFSITNNELFFTQNSITVINDTIQNKCGYLFEIKNQKDEFKSAMTDIELKTFTKEFFKIQDK